MIESTKLIKMNILFLVFLGGRSSEKEYFLCGSNIDKNRQPLIVVSGSKGLFRLRLQFMIFE